MKNSSKEIIVHIALLAAMVAGHLVATSCEKSSAEQVQTTQRPTTAPAQKLSLLDVLKR